MGTRIDNNPHSIGIGLYSSPTLYHIENPVTDVFRIDDIPSTISYYIIKKNTFRLLSTIRLNKKLAMNTPDNPDNKLGMTMYILAWVIAFGLVAAFFNDLLKDQQNPNNQHTSRITNERYELVLKPNRQHHYLSTGTINHQKVVFLLDTGATDVAIPAKLAKKLGLSKGREQYVYTANGRAKVYSTNLQSLTLGDIRLSNISANISPGMDDEIILLGMSALKHLEFTQKGELLILRQ